MSGRIKTNKTNTTFSVLHTTQIHNQLLAAFPVCRMTWAATSTPHVPSVAVRAETGHEPHPVFPTNGPVLLPPQQHERAGQGKLTLLLHPVVAVKAQVKGSAVTGDM